LRSRALVLLPQARALFAEVDDQFCTAGAVRLVGASHLLAKTRC
jgi:hypothetical protein